MKNNKVTPKPTPYTTVCVSGGFDPVHIGHLRMIQEASKFGNVIVIVNSDDWLMRKKGYIFMPFNERCEILEGFTATSSTISVDDSDNTVCEALRRIKPDYFANGGDRKTNNTPEMNVCEELGIEMLWGVGGGKIQSSSTLVSDAGMDPDLPEDDELQPSKVEIVQSGDVPKLGNY
jgi:D-beta-D-heptose 7-phosphate kinase/D-beta-D-heptose 1-phosphate adenosyltransferase